MCQHYLHKYNELFDLVDIVSLFSFLISLTLMPKLSIIVTREKQYKRAENETSEYDAHCFIVKSAESCDSARTKLKFYIFKGKKMKMYSLFMCALLVLAPNAFADWTLQTEESLLNFVSIKKDAIAEISHFKQFNGSIDEKGKLSVSVDLSSVDTKIGIRDERLKNNFFNVSKYANAMLTGNVEISRASSLENGDYYTDLVNLTLSLHGVDKQVQAEVTIVKLNENKWLVSSAKPVIVNAGDYKLAEGIETLKKLAGLPNISLAVPVTFELIFKK